MTKGQKTSAGGARCGAAEQSARAGVAAQRGCELLDWAPVGITGVSRSRVRRGSDEDDDFEEVYGTRGRFGVHGVGQEWMGVHAAIAIGDLQKAGTRRRSGSTDTG